MNPIIIKMCTRFLNSSGCSRITKECSWRNKQKNKNDLSEFDTLNDVILKEKLKLHKGTTWQERFQIMYKIKMAKLDKKIRKTEAYSDYKSIMSIDSILGRK